MTLSREDRMALVHRLRDGDPAAREELILATMGLARSISRFYAKRYPRVSREDLEQAGYLGIVEAVNRFDPNRGTHFTTVAWWWVWLRVREEVDKSNLIRVPTLVHPTGYRSVPMELVDDLGDIEAPSVAVGPEEKAFIAELLADHLSLAERDAVTLRFGLDTGIPMTFQEIGAAMEIGRETARNLVIRALKVCAETLL